VVGAELKVFLFYEALGILLEAEPPAVLLHLRSQKESFRQIQKSQSFFRTDPILLEETSYQTSSPNDECFALMRHIPNSEMHSSEDLQPTLVYGDRKKGKKSKTRLCPACALALVLVLKCLVFLVRA